MRSVIYTKDDEFLALREDWKSLHSRSKEKSIFIDFDWTYNIWLNLPSKKQLKLITIWDEDKLVSALPLIIIKKQVIGRHTATILQHLCCRYTDHSIVLTDSNYSRKNLLKLNVREISSLSSQVSFIKIDNLSSSHQNSRIFLKLLRDLPNPSTHYINVENPILDLTETNAIDVKQAKDTERRLKKLSKAHKVEIRIAQEIDQPIWEKLVEYHSTKFPKHGFNLPESQKFYRQLIHSDFDNQNFEFSYILVDGEPKAIHFGFRNHSTVYYYVPSYDSRLQSYGIGQILLMEIIKYYQAQGYKKFDMLRGSEPYKYAWMSDEFHNISFLGVGAPSRINRWALYLFSLVKTISRLKK